MLEFVTQFSALSYCQADSFLCEHLLGQRTKLVLILAINNIRKEKCRAVLANTHELFNYRLFATCMYRESPVAAAHAAAINPTIR